jgi:exodeoxyribonuclease VII large subunit
MPALTVSQLTGIIRGVIAQSPLLEDVLVEGEISDLSRPASGHLYFTLKDATAAVGCVVWRSQLLQIPFRPDSGMTVIVHGHVEVYDARGRYQLYIDRIDPAGVGALARAVEQRRRALAAEGLFDEARKRGLPLLPRRVVVVTSRSGAALGDVLTVMGRRAPGVEVVLSPATVQGEGAAETLVVALERAQSVAGAEVVLLVRGGGSLEDLMAFNDERVARVIRSGRLPVVTGVGHETDVTIADLAADRRAATPSAAAELVAPDCRRLAAEMAGRRVRLRGAIGQALTTSRGALERSWHRLDAASPLRRLPSRRQELDARAGRLRSGLVAALAVKRGALDARVARLQLGSPGQRLSVERERLAGRRHRLAALTAGSLDRRRDLVASRRAQLDALSPLRVLERGYSITLDETTGGLVTDAVATRPGQRLRTRLGRGSVLSRVEASTAGPERMYDGAAE